MYADLAKVSAEDGILHATVSLGAEKFRRDVLRRFFLALDFQLCAEIVVSALSLQESLPRKAK